MMIMTATEKRTFLDLIVETCESYLGLANWYLLAFTPKTYIKIKEGKKLFLFWRLFP